MRTILFRGKTKKGGEWVEGDLIYRNIWGVQVYIIRVGDSGFDIYEEYEVTQETIGQYRFTNKYNQKVFIGDWLERQEISVFSPNIIKQICLVGEDKFGNIKIVDSDRIDLKYFRVEELLDFKVIGNKWDNPELLGDSHEKYI